MSKIIRCRPIDITQRVIEKDYNFVKRHLCCLFETKVTQVTNDRDYVLQSRLSLPSSTFQTNGLMASVGS